MTLIEVIRNAINSYKFASSFNITFRFSIWQQLYFYVSVERVVAFQMAKQKAVSSVDIYDVSRPNDSEAYEYVVLHVNRILCHIAHRDRPVCVYARH